MSGAESARELLLLGEVRLTVPPGFHLMTESERSRMNMASDGEWAGLSDPKRHMIVTFGHMKLGLAPSLLLSGGDLTKHMEKRIRKPMEEYGYTRERFTERTAAGLQAYGFRYTYKAQGTAMLGESCVAKSGRTVYTFHLYVREALRDEGLALWDELLNNARIERTE